MPMPFKSKAQMRFMFARHPTIAKRWAKEYDTPKELPEHVRKKAKHDTIKKMLRRKG
jgi:hypothetical protein